jgi:hypothetical protein
MLAAAATVLLVLTTQRLPAWVLWYDVIISGPRRALAGT